MPTQTGLIPGTSYNTDDFAVTTPEYKPTTAYDFNNPAAGRPKLDAVDQANLNYYNKAGAAGDSNPLPNETAQNYVLRAKARGAGLYVEPLPGESAADFKRRNDIATYEDVKNRPANNTSVLGDTGIILGSAAATTMNPLGALTDTYGLPDYVAFGINPVGETLRQGTNGAVGQIPGAGSDIQFGGVPADIAKAAGAIPSGGQMPAMAKPGAGGGAGGNGVTPELQSYIDNILAAGSNERQVDPYSDMLAYNPYTEDQGPSQAEALYKTMLDQRVGDALALGASARGGPGAVARAQRQARAQNSAQQQRASNELAALRAQEEQARRQRLLEGYTSERNRYSQERTQRTVADITAETADLNRQLEAATAAGDKVAEQLLRDKINANNYQVADLGGWWDYETNRQKLNALEPSTLEKLGGGTLTALEVAQKLGIL